MSNEKKQKTKNEWHKNYYKTDKGRATRNRGRLKYYRKTAFSKNYKKPWTEAEELVVLSHRETDTEISKKLGRSVASIQMKRVRLKRKLGYTE